jgi:superfamily I DNA/RNA helicase
VELSTSSGVGLYQLPVNYRSMPHICLAATRLVEGQKWHLSGKILPILESNLEGPLQNCFTIKKFRHQMEEARWTISDVLVQYRKGTLLKDMCIQSRLAQYLHLVEIECIRNKIPYEKRAAGSFMDSKEVQDILAYLRVAMGLDHDGTQGRRCVLSPFKYISSLQLKEAEKTRSETGRTFIESLLYNVGLGRKQRYAIVRLQDIIGEIHGAIDDGTSPARLVKMVIDKTEYVDYIRERDGLSTVDSSKMAILEELQHTASLFEDTLQFITFVDTVSASIKLGRKVLSTGAPDQDRLILTTIHRNKGLEFDRVYIGDVAQGRFPWNKAWSLDEELRLMYVAVTRARYHVTLTCSMTSDDVESTLLARLKDCI